MRGSGSGDDQGRGETPNEGEIEAVKSVTEFFSDRTSEAHSPVDILHEHEWEAVTRWYCLCGASKGFDE